MTVSQIIDNTNFDEIDIDPSQLEFKTNIVDGLLVKSGFFLKGTKQLAGIGRKEFKNGYISEGFFNNGSQNGYCRGFWSDASRYYIGEWKNDYRHGKGKTVYSNGRIKDGRWERNTFKGQE